MVAKIISDCPNRVKFETLLDTLATLKHNDLVRTQQLFESCGSFYSERKAVMVSRLERELDVLKDNIAFLIILDSEKQSH